MITSLSLPYPHIVSICFSICIILSLNLSERRLSGMISVSAISPLSSSILLGKEISSWENDFAFLFYRNLSHVINQRNPKSFLFSPYSMYITLIGIYEAAKLSTQSELHSILQLRSIDNYIRRNQSMNYIQNMLMSQKNNRNQRKDSTVYKESMSYHRLYNLSIASILWIDKTYPINQEYSKLLKVAYHTVLRNVNFKYHSQDIQQKMIHWLVDHSRNPSSSLGSSNIYQKSKYIIPEDGITPRTKVIAANTISLSNIKWKYPFPMSETSNESYWISHMKTIDVPMMKLAQKSFYYVEDHLFQVIEIPLESLHNEISVIMLLPKANEMLDTLKKRLDDGALRRWFKLMTLQQIEVLMIPKFSIFSNYPYYEIDNTLKMMGIQSIYSDMDHVDLTGLHHHDQDRQSKEKVYVDSIFHSCSMTMDEYGISIPSDNDDGHGHGHGNNKKQKQKQQEVNNVVVVIESNREKYYYFIATHPFLYLIRDTLYGKILFMGQVINPTDTT